ncbi:hypothetical protein Sipo8835_17260 [Streptomyces ipomoeae]|uniref:Uncharacterized protein n=2 Tax=Streptomyces ipomoeae TaxID=103232 RepID=L1KKD4_9ACTN|nr:hypothetical protein [Streptomyces ipomoeae]EKX61034.1 hypothetical protein STRIP9103_01946 [Streptomyces ipomoeae 91-03]MDX2699839.1 hypothetical protein [Streptomyces ipomoeae]MDX2844845.1 hypothetical protein [Streptomyces ipomoeae]MDX2935130.1 hypothetical protein [Streptomyces ipomoeae]TQE19147.1 hypothetical protein SipoB123_32020 [Streptomyces ipomoeae]
MVVFGFLEWCRRLRAAHFVTAGDPPGCPPDSAADEDAPAALDDATLKAYAMQRPEWADALIQVENARVDGEIRLLSVRLLLGTACGSVLLFSIAVAARVTPGIRLGVLTPLSTAALGALAAAIVTALAAGIGKALRSRSGAAQSPVVNDPARPSGEPPSEPGPERGGAPRQE